MGNEVAKVAPKESGSHRRTVIATTTGKSSKDANVGHITNRFTYYYPNWESYLDDAGNMYYYNDVLKETVWDPAEIYGGPPQPPCQDGGNYQDISWDAPAPSLGSTGKSLSHTRSITDHQAKKAMQMEERKEIIAEDPMAHWKELAQVGHIDPDVIEEHVLESSAVVAEVSQGSFEPELLYKLPWAYKVQQLSAAVKESYLQVGDMFDSSKYDNCNDVPRYDDGGLVSWWSDLEDLHLSVNMVIDSGVVGQESERYTEEMKKLQAIATSGNEEEMLEGFLARRIEVEKELDSLRARCFAVVCMESGPTREQLDNIYSYLKDNVNGDTVLEEIQDEMEEVVSGTLEQKHRFMVDVVLMMGLLEDEDERLQRRIKSFKGKARHINEDGEEVGEEGQESYDEDAYAGYYDEYGNYIETAGEYTYDESAYKEGAFEYGTEAHTDADGGITVKDAILAHDKQMVQSKVAEQTHEAQRLADELQHQRDSRSKALKDRLAKKKADRAKELAEEGLDSEEAAAKVELEIAEEEAKECEEMDKMVTEALRTRDEEIKQKLNEVCDEEAARINGEAEEERAEKVKGLQQTLEEQKAIRIAEIMAERGCTEAEATALAEDEIEQQEEEGLRDIEKEILEKAEKRRLAVVESIRDQHLKTSSALENELAAQKDRKVKSLKQRLEKKKELKAAELMNTGVSAHEAVAMADIDLKENLEVELKKIEEESQVQIEEAKMMTVNAMKEMQEKEATRLEQDLLLKESRQKKSLHERLQKREKKREQSLQAEGVSAADAKKIAAEEQVKAEKEAMKQLELEIQQIKQVQEAEAAKLQDYNIAKKENTQKALKDRLAKRKAKKETELSSEEKLEQFLSTVREKQKQDMTKLIAFIESEKKRAMETAERRDAEEMSNTSIQTAMLFSTLKECLINGYKKQCVYQVRAIKDSMEPRDLTKDENAAAMRTACEQLIMRHSRDQKGVWDSQIAEQSKARANLQEDCAPADKIVEMEEKYYRRNVDSLRKQQTQLFLTLCGVHLDMSLLQRDTNISSSSNHKKSDFDDDEDDIFGDMDDQGSVSFSAAASQWLDGCLGLRAAYDKTPETLLSKFQYPLLQINQVQDGASPSDIGPAGAVFYQVSLIILKALCEAFQNQVSQSSAVASHASAGEKNIKTAIQQAVQVYQSDLTLEAAFTAMEASRHVQTKFKAAMAEFLSDPVSPTTAFLEALHSMKEKSKAPAPSAHASPAVTQKLQVDENIERKNRMLKSIDTKVDRKRKDIREKYRKRMDAKLHECKETKVEVPANFTADEDNSLRNELENLDSAVEEIKDVIENNVQSLNLISVDGLMFALEKRLKGEVVETSDLKQLEAEAEKENEKNEAKRLMKAQKDEAEKLDVMLKVQRAREQQALQKRLLARKAKGKN